LAGNDEAEAREGPVRRACSPTIRDSSFEWRSPFLRDPHDAEEVVQETFLRLYRNSAWKEMRDERAFLARAAWRIADPRPATEEPDGGSFPWGSPRMNRVRKLPF